jgi:hypothetical protein
MFSIPRYITGSREPSRTISPPGEVAVLSWTSET